MAGMRTVWCVQSANHGPFDHLSLTTATTRSNKSILVGEGTTGSTALNRRQIRPGLPGLRQQAVQIFQKWPHRPAGGNHPAGKIGRQDLLVGEVTHDDDLLELEQIDIWVVPVIAFGRSLEARAFDSPRDLDES